MSIWYVFQWNESFSILRVLYVFVCVSVLNERVDMCAAVYWLSRYRNLTSQCNSNLFVSTGIDCMYLAVYPSCDCVLHLCQHVWRMLHADGKQDLTLNRQTHCTETHTHKHAHPIQLAHDLKYLLFVQFKLWFFVSPIYCCCCCSKHFVFSFRVSFPCFADAVCYIISQATARTRCYSIQGINIYEWNERSREDKKNCWEHKSVCSLVSSAYFKQERK